MSIHIVHMTQSIKSCLIVISVFVFLPACSNLRITDTLNPESTTLVSTQASTPLMVPSPIMPSLLPTNTPIPPTITLPPIGPLPLLAFEMDRDPFGRNSQSNIYTIRADGTGLTRLVEEPANTCCPRWSPDGRWIAFLGNDPDEWFFKLYILDYVNGEIIRVPSENVGAFSWAPDSQRIAYTEDIVGPDHTHTLPSKIYLVNLPLRTPSILYDAPWPILHLEWSPSSDLILVFPSSSGEEFWLHLLDVDGNISQYQLSQRVGSSLTWHPSGQFIAYDTFVDSINTRSEIRVINVDGTNDHILIHSDDNLYHPQWSPSGDLLAYIRQPLGGVSRVYITDLRDGRTWLVPRGRGKPVWSSDGSYLAYFSETRLIQETGYSLYVYSTGSDTAQALVEEYVTFGLASWQPSP